MQDFKLTVPNKLSELTLGQYQRFSKILTDDIDQDFLHKKMIEIFCGVPLKHVDNFKYSSIKKVTGMLTELFDQKPKLTNRFEMAGIKFGFHPKLSDMTFGEFLDVDSYANDWSTMDKALGVLFRPIKDEFKGSYLIDDYNAEKETFMSLMPLDVALGAVFFLLNLKDELTSRILSYSQEKLKQEYYQIVKHSPKNGDSILRCIAYLQAM